VPAVIARLDLAYVLIRAFNVDDDIEARGHATFEIGRDVPAEPRAQVIDPYALLENDVLVAVGGDVCPPVEPLGMYPSNFVT
jgi:hypothetical protein